MYKTTHLEATGNETMDSAQSSSDAPLVPMRGQVYVVIQTVRQIMALVHGHAPPRGQFSNGV